MVALASFPSNGVATKRNAYILWQDRIHGKEETVEEGGFGDR